MSEWQPIETAPKDGSLIRVSYYDEGYMNDTVMRWGHIQQNGLFPGTVGMWVSPCQSVTWNDDGDDGPTHWRAVK